MTELAKKKGGFRSYWMSTSIAILLYLLVDLGVLLGDPKRFISSGESALLLFTSCLIGILFAAILAILISPLPIPKENSPWVGFLVGMTIIWMLDQFLSFESLSDLDGFTISTILVAILLAAALSYRPPKPKLRIAIVLALSFGFSGRLATAPPRNDTAPPPKNAPNLLLITIDSIRLELFRTNEISALFPNFHRLTKSGVFFTGVSAASADTKLAHQAILSSTGPWAEAPHISLADHLSSQGYQTSAFIGEQGLASFVDDEGYETVDDDFGWIVGFNDSLWGRLIARNFQTPSTRSDVQTFHRFEQWITERPTFRPFFSWVHLNTPHCPYAPPPPHNADHYAGDPYDPAHEGMPDLALLSDCQQQALKGITDPEYVKALYLGELTALDDEIGRYLDTLSDLGLESNTLIVIAGAHGENLGEDGVWFEHGSVLNDAALSVPVWMRFPDILPENRKVSARIETQDIVPTALEIMVADSLSNVEGRSFVQAIYGASLERAILRSVRFEEGRMVVSIRSSQRRYDDQESRQLEMPDHKAAVDAMIDSNQKRLKSANEGKLHSP